MTKRHIEDWRTLEGAAVEIRQRNAVVFVGIVDAVTEDGTILWVQSPVNGRRLFEKATPLQAWAVEEGAGFHYKVGRWPWAVA